jgi:hypothetical protein
VHYNFVALIKRHLILRAPNRGGDISFRLRHVSPLEASQDDNVVSDSHVRAQDVFFKWIQWKHSSHDAGKGLPLINQDANVRTRMKYLDLAPLLVMFGFSRRVNSTFAHCMTMSLISPSLTSACSSERSGSWAVAALLQQLEDISLSADMSMLSSSIIKELECILGGPDSFGILHRITDICSEANSSQQPQECVLKCMRPQLLSGLRMVLVPMLSKVNLAAAKAKITIGASAAVQSQFSRALVNVCSRIFSLSPEPYLPLQSSCMRFRQPSESQAKETLQVCESIVIHMASSLQSPSCIFPPGNVEASATPFEAAALASVDHPPPTRPTVADLLGDS